MTAYHRPTTLQEAVILIGQTDDALVVAGGTDVYPARASAQAWGRTDRRTIIDISALSDLKGIHDRGDHWRIGALTTWTEIARADLPPIFDGLRAAARDVGGAQVQNRGTIGGNCMTASPAGDGIPCLMALSAEIEATEGTTFHMPAEQFFTGYRATAIDRSLLSAIRIPKQNGRGYFKKLGARDSLVISIAMVAAVFDWDARGNVSQARVVVGACSPVAQRLSALEDALRGKPLDPALVKPEHFARLTPIDDVRASANYRRAAARQLVKDAIADAANYAGGGSG